MSEIDTISARELQLFIENDADLYRQQFVPIQKNLTAKKARGVYKRPLAVKLFGYLVESGAKKYVKEFDSSNASWHEVFPKAVRDTVAEELTDEFEHEHELGNYSEYVPKKYQPKPAKKKSTRTSKAAGLGGMRG